tara:strand:+ start:2704 stop:3207 length:504 start_codon:yes stop_codon:yes gene_type:complete
MSTDYEPIGSIIEKPETVVIGASPQTVVVGTSTSPFGAGISNTGRPMSMMSFTDSIITVLSKYIDFSGRASRSEYWWFYLATLIVGFGLGIIDGILFGWRFEDPTWLSDIFNLVILLPILAAGVRRIHDHGKSGWFILVPFYNLYLLIADGQPQPNLYGQVPTNVRP